MASIKKRPNGKYQARIYVGRDAGGKQIFECVTKDTWHECKAAARDIEDELEKGNYISTLTRKTKVTDWVDEWIELNRERLSPSTVKLYKMYLQAHYKPFFKNMTLGQAANNEILLRRFMAEKLKALTANTVCKLMTVLNKIFRESLRDKNPIRYIEMPKKEKYIPYVLTDEEFKQIHKTVKGTTDELFVLLGGWCGLRLGEICALKPNDVFKEKGVIVVDENLTINDKYGWEFKPPKSDNGFRNVAVPEYLMNLIIEHIKEQKKIPERIFDYLPGSYTHRWAKIVKEKKLPKIRFHDLRHYHLSWLYKNNVPDQYAAKRAGHDVCTLKKIYQHLRVDVEKEMDDNVREMLNNKKVGTNPDNMQSVE
jgi:integrase